MVFITSSYGLGETVVQGAVNPDEFYVHKPTLRGRQARRSSAATWARKLITHGVRHAPRRRPPAASWCRPSTPPPEQRNRYSLTDADVIELARYALIIEQHYGRPMDIEWGKDGGDGKLYILQARPETVKSQAEGKVEQRYKLKGDAADRCWPRAAPSARRSAPARCAWCTARPRWTACSPATCWSPT